MNIGIVGHDAAKFTAETEAEARRIIRSLLTKDDVMVSGHCHLGGIDIWAEEEAAVLGCELRIFKPARKTWLCYKKRNIEIAKHSDVVHVIVVAKYPDTYTGLRFPSCYHCKTDKHVKSGGCWTARFAEKLGKEAVWHVI